MKIESIQLYNFRQFKGEHKLTFSMSSDKNVSVIMGENGSGKTTLEQAFRWCLYGTNDFKVSELLNREIKELMGTDDEEKVRVEIILEHNNVMYKVTRYQILSKKIRALKVIKDGFLMREQDELGEWRILNKDEAYVQMKTLLPESLARFFFFDGERIEAMSRTLLDEKKSEEFQEAVKGLVGLDAALNAINHFGPENLKRTVMGKFFQDVGASGNNKVEEITEQINRYNSDVQQLQERIQVAKEEAERFQRDLTKAENKKNEMRDSIGRSNEVRKYTINLNQYQSNKKKHAERYVHKFAENSQALCSKYLAEQALTVIKEAGALDSGIPELHADAVQFLLDRGSCICGADLSSDAKKREHLEKLLQMLPPYSVSTLAAHFASELQELVSNVDNIETELQELLKDERNDEAQIADMEDRLSMIDRNLPSQEKIESLNNQIARFKKLKMDAENEFAKLNSQKGKVDYQLKNAINKRNELLIEDQRNRKNLVYLSYARAVYEKLHEYYKVREIDTRKMLQDEINSIFEDIYDGGIRINVADNYTITTDVIDPNGQFDGTNLEQNTAQSYAIIFAFIAGLIELAKRKYVQRSDEYTEEDVDRVDGYPLVMDAPLSSFDKSRIHKICKELPRIAEQVVIFIKDTDGELAEQHLADRIGSKWTLIADSKICSHIERRM